MPFVAESDVPLEMRGSIAPQEQPAFKDSPGLGELSLAALRVNNPVASLIDYVTSTRPDMRPEPNYSVFDDPQIKGTRYEYENPDAFFGSPNAAYTGWIKARMERERKDREMLASSGSAGATLAIAAGFLDPIQWVPLIGAVAKGRGLASTAQTAGRFAAYGAGSAAVSEAALQGTQYTRTGAESFENIASSAFVMGLLGAAVGRFVTPREVQAISDDIADLRGVARETVDAPAGETSSYSIRDGKAWELQAVTPEIKQEVESILDRITPGRAKGYALFRDDLSADAKGMRAHGVSPEQIDGGQALVAGMTTGNQYTTVIQIARALPNASEMFPLVARHESIHALKRMGLFTREEWGELTRAAQTYDWMRLSRKNDVEEAIAEAFAHWGMRAANPEIALKIDSKIERIFQKVVDFYTRLMEAMGGNAREKWEGIFKQIETGDIGQRTIPGTAFYSGESAARFSKAYREHGLQRQKLKNEYPGGISAFEKLPFDEQEAFLKSRGLPEDPRQADFSIVSGDGGAASSDRRQLKPVSIGIDQLPALAERVREVPYVGTFLHDAARMTSDLFTRTSPTMRTFFQDYSLTARRAMADMAETSLRFVDNTVGIPTSYHGAISRIVRNEQTRLQLKAQEIIDDLWSQHYHGPDTPTAPVIRANMDRLMGNVPEGKMDLSAFKAEVSRAAWSGDTHAIPQVQQAAQMIRKEILEPVRKMMVEAGIASEEMLKPRGDASFFPRIWNKKVVAERRNEFRTKIADWYEQEQAIKAAAKERLQLLAADHAGHVADIERLESRLESIQAKAANTNTRLSERGMEARATEKRADTLEGRLGEVQSQISELEEFLANVRRELPEARAQVSDLERELAQLRREAAPLSKAEEARIAKEDINRALPDEDWRDAALQFLGRKKPEEENIASLSGWIIREGGIKDFKGEVRSIVGRGTPSRLINNSGMTLEELGMKLYEKAKWAFDGERPTVAEVLEVVRDAHNGVQPYWWREAILGQDGMDRAARVADRRDILAEMADLTGREPKSMRDVSEMLLLGFNENPAVLDRLMEKAQAGREMGAAENTLEVRRQNLAALREHLPKAIADRNALERKGVVQGAATREAGSAANRNRGRMELLQDRADTQAKIAAVYSDTIALLEKRRLEIRDKIETEIRDWKGNSSVEALAELEKRDEALAKRQAAMAAGEYKGRGERLRSADKAVDRAVNRIVDSERDLSRLDLEGRADETIDRILGGPDGRLNYDVDSVGNPRMGPPSNEPPPRGSAHEREFAIPTEMIADFVERDTDTVISSFLRTALPDIELTKRFGDVEMRDVFRGVNEDFAAKAREIGDNPKQMRLLEARRQRQIEDLAAVRDKLRNVYGWSSSPGGQKAARFANAARAFNAMADLGSSTLNSMGDLAGAVFRYGFQGVYRDGWEPYFKGMLGMSEAGPALKRQMKAAGIAVETHLNLRHHQLSDISENWRPGNRFERALSWGAEKSQLLNLQAPYTDFAKTIAGSVAQAEILRAAERVSLGKATQKEITQLAEASIDPATAAKIWSEFQNGGGDVIDGVRLANSDKWRDRAAARAFENAISREADIAVVTPGMEKPLWMSTPVAGLLGQFKSFVAGTHERTLIAGLQRRDANTLQGLMAAVAMGMLSYRLYTLASGKEASDKPQEWIKEGISRSGVMGWFDEVNSITAKATGGKGDIFRLIGADKELSRYQSRSILSSLLGPTAGRVEGLAGITRAVATGEAAASDIAQARRLLPLQNHFALRRLLNEVEDGVAHTMGIEPADRSPRP